MFNNIFRKNYPNKKFHSDDICKNLSYDCQKNQKNPPDLDEIWQDFNKRVRNFLGQKKNENTDMNYHATGPGPSFPRQILGFGSIFFFVIFIIWLSSGFFIIQEGQVAVITRFGQYSRTAQAGFRWRFPYPLERHSIVNISQLRTFEIGFRGSSRNKMLSEALMLTNDENIVDMQFVVQYRLRSDGAPNYLFKVKNPDDSVRQAAETAMREVVGKKPMDFVLYEGRTDVTAEVQTLMQSILNYYESGIQISTVAIQNVQPPEQVQAAFDDAVKAGQDRERQINEGQAYANQVIPWASGQASRMLEEAEGCKARIIGDAKGKAARFISILNEYEKAPEITRDRIYLESMQKMFSEVGKIMIDTQNHNNVLYLPLDRISRLEDVKKGSSNPTFDLNSTSSEFKSNQLPSSAKSILNGPIPEITSSDRLLSR